MGWLRIALELPEEPLPSPPPSPFPPPLSLEAAASLRFFARVARATAALPLFALGVLTILDAWFFL